MNAAEPIDNPSLATLLFKDDSLAPRLSPLPVDAT